MNKLSFQNSGFTFVEMLIVVFIIGLLSATLVANTRSGNNLNNLRFAAQNLSETLKQAQSMTLAGRTTAGAVPAGGYGARIVLNSALAQDRFLLCANNQFNDFVPCGAGDSIIERISLPAANITVQAYINNTLSAANFIDVAFASPSGAIYINGNVGSNLRVVLRNPANQTSEVYLDSNSGLIQ